MLKPIKQLLLLLLFIETLNAIENIEYAIETNLFYATYNDYYNNTRDLGSLEEVRENSLFDKESSIGELGLQLGASADITEYLNGGFILAVTSPMGMQNFMTDGTFTGSMKTKVWINEAWIGAQFKKTSLKVGRMQIDTPFLFSEDWSVVPESFESIILHSNDIKDTLVYLAAVVKYNGPSVLSGGYADYYYKDREVDEISDGNIFQKFGNNGALAIGAINSSIENLKLQGWYYGIDTDPNDKETHMLNSMKSFWLQADLELKDTQQSGYLAGVQFSATKYDYEKNSQNNVLGLMLGYTHRDIFTAKVSYTKVGDDNTNQTGVGKNLAGNESRLYTEAWWAYGVITRNDTQAYNLSLKYSPKDYVMGLYYTQATNRNGFATGTNYESDADLTEVTLELSRELDFKDYGNADLGFFYVYTEYANDNQPDITQKGKPYSSVHLNLIYNF